MPGRTDDRDRTTGRGPTEFLDAVAARAGKLGTRTGSPNLHHARRTGTDRQAEAHLPWQCGEY